MIPIIVRWAHELKNCFIIEKAVPFERQKWPMHRNVIGYPNGLVPHYHHHKLEKFLESRFQEGSQGQATKTKLFLGN